MEKKQTIKNLIIKMINDNKLKNEILNDLLKLGYKKSTINWYLNKFKNV